MVPKRLEGPGFKGKRPRAERLSNSERPGKRYFSKDKNGILTGFVSPIPNKPFEHSSKSSSFVQKFNYDFPRKLSMMILGEKLVKML